MSGERDVADIRHSKIFLGIEPCVSVAAVPCGSRHSAETVHNEHRMLLLFPFAESKRLGGEAVSSGIASHDSEAVYPVVFHLDIEMCRLRLSYFPESGYALGALIDYVSVGHCRRLKLVGTGRPRETVFHCAGTPDGEIGHGERLNHHLARLALAYETRQPLVDGSADKEAEIRVKPIFHVAEILMRHKLDQRRGHFRDPCLDIRLVPHRASCPPRLHALADISCYLAHHKVGEHA